MISVKLKGGLGNLMFQIAAIEHLAYKNNSTVGYYNWDSHLEFMNEDAVTPKMTYAKDYNIVFKNLSFPKCSPLGKTINIPFHYTKLFFQEGVCYEGYFQSEKYFPDRDFVTNLFTPSDTVSKKLKKYDYLFSEGTTCAIHVRRGDYVFKFSHLYLLPDHDSLEYYKKGIELVQADRYIVFSDDIEWCKQNFKGKNYFFIEDKDYIELFLMAKCDHNIITNSSFSWWGAWLNQNPNKICIGPKQWFARPHVTESDIVPESYIKI